MTGNVTFTYSIQDGVSLLEAVGTVNIIITASAAPVATADAYTCPFNATCAVNATAGVLANDSPSVPGSGISVLTGMTTQPANGTVVMSADGSFNFTPGA